MAKRILITDDALFMRVTLKNILTQNGFDVVGEASNGAESVELYKSLKPDVVTMDITMPEMDGIAAVRQLRAMHHEAKVVILTIHTRREFVEACLAHGALGYVLKARIYTDLIPAINAALCGRSFVSSER